MRPQFAHKPAGTGYCIRADGQPCEEPKPFAFRGQLPAPRYTPSKSALSQRAIAGQALAIRENWRHRMIAIDVFNKARFDCSQIQRERTPEAKRLRARLMIIEYLMKVDHLVAVAWLGGPIDTGGPDPTGLKSTSLRGERTNWWLAQAMAELETMIVNNCGGAAPVFVQPAR